MPVCLTRFFAPFSELLNGFELASEACSLATLLQSQAGHSWAILPVMPRQRKARQAPAQCSTDPAAAAAAAPPSLLHPGHLPPAVELLTLVFSSLHASDVGRAACMHPAWRIIISREARAWTLAMAELDPFRALGGAQGASRLFRSVGGCWLRTAAVLAAMGGRGAGCCDKCGVGGHHSSLKLCRCPPQG